MKFKTIIQIIFLSFSLAMAGCNGMLDIKPVNSMMPKSILDYEAVLLGGYPRTDFFVKTEMLTDNIYVNFNSTSLPTQEVGRWFTFSSSLIDPNNTSDPYWGQLYKSIFYANTVLDKVSEITPETVEKKLHEQVLGEAYALRAFSYFYLINFYADVYTEANFQLPGVPMPLTAVDVNATAGDNVREPIQNVWNQIKKDLDLSSGLLEGKNIKDRYRFNYNIVQLLSARVSLMMGDNESAIKYATTVASNYPLADLSSLETTIANSNGLKGVLTYIYGFVNTPVDKEIMFLVGGRANMNPYYYVTGALKPSEELLDLSKRYGELSDYRQFIFDSFEDLTTTQGRQTGKTVYKMYASQNLLSYYVAFKSSEAYLIRAEANARLKNKDKAIAEINMILKSRMRQDHLVQLNPANFNTDEEVLIRILEERRLEMGLDGGSRFMDLRRLGKPKIVHVYENAEVYSLEKNDPRYIMQIPPSEINNSPTMPLNPR